MKNNEVLFYGTTGYHLLLFNALIHQLGEKNTYLVYSPVSSHHHKFGLNYIEKMPYRGVWIKPRYSKYRVVNWVRNMRYSRLDAKSIVNEVNPKRIYASKDSDIIVQSILGRAAQKKTIYVEDGMAAYDDTYLSDENRLKSNLKQKIYGAFYENVRVLGTTKYIDEIAVTHGKNVRDELRVYDKIKIKRKGFVERNKRIFRVVGEKYEGVETLFILPLSSTISKEEKRCIEERIKNCAHEDKSKPFIKYHPREKTNYIMCSKSDYKKAKKEIPVEIVYVYSKKLKHVYGANSTALKSAKWIDPSVSIQNFKSIDSR